MWHNLPSAHFYYKKLLHPKGGIIEGGGLIATLQP